MKPAAKDSNNLVFREADERDVASIIALVNSAYRGELSKKGWTTEADILDGQRTDEDEVSVLIAAKDSQILLGRKSGELVGCLHLKNAPSGTELGMFAIKPELQGGGIGSAFIAEAEHQARQIWRSPVLRMQVITLRQGLIAFYERRGYRRTGRFFPFPDSPKFGLPKVANLRLEVLEKSLA